MSPGRWKIQQIVTLFHDVAERLNDQLVSLGRLYLPDKNDDGMQVRRRTWVMSDFVPPLDVSNTGALITTLTPDFLSKSSGVGESKEKENPAKSGSVSQDR